jgi:hypothetical protein
MNCSFRYQLPNLEDIRQIRILSYDLPYPHAVQRLSQIEGALIVLAFAIGGNILAPPVSGWSVNSWHWRLRKANTDLNDPRI